MAVSNAGFESVGMADSIEGERSRLVLAPFSTDTRATLSTILEVSRLDGLVDVKNPFDVTPMAGDTVFADMMVEVLGDDKIDELTKLKSKEDLLGEVVTLLQSPITNIVGGLQAQGSNLVGAIKTIAEKAEA